MTVASPHHRHHGHGGGRRGPAAATGSLLRSSALARLGGAALAVAAIWAGVFWAIA